LHRMAGNFLTGSRNINPSISNHSPQSKVGRQAGRQLQSLPRAQQ
jgi:hypothetical protein